MARMKGVRDCSTDSDEITSAGLPLPWRAPRLGKGGLQAGLLAGGSSLGRPSRGLPQWRFGVALRGQLRGQLRIRLAPCRIPFEPANAGLGYSGLFANPCRCQAYLPRRCKTPCQQAAVAADLSQAVAMASPQGPCSPPLAGQPATVLNAGIFRGLGRARRQAPYRRV